MLTTESLTFRYAKGPEFVFPDLHLADGEHLLILGPSGVGKTTLLHLLAALRHPQQGRILLDEVEMQLLTGPAADRYRGQHIGVVFQRPYFVHSLSAIENLLLMQRIARVARSEERAHEVLDRLGLAALADKKPYRMSQGEQQRLSIALAVQNRPRLLLADEPTSSLDDLNSMKVLDLLQEEAERSGAHLVIITHDSRIKSGFEHHLTL